jgi:hypothetical protein
MGDLMGDQSVNQPDLFYDTVTWALKFAWLPHRCDITGREIWFEWAYCGINKVLSSNRDYRRWITRDTWLVEKLKGAI